MMYFDDKLTESMQDWLNTEPAQRDFAAGAEMMLKFNHNKILYHNAIRRPDKMMGKVESELRKFLRMQLDRVTTEQVMVMDAKIIPAAAKTIEENAPVINSDDDVSLPPTVAKGKRADHDKLPAHIQELWDGNADIYFKIKELFETLKGLEKALPCDRYEYLVQLKELDIAYHKRLEAYDAYVITAADAMDNQPKAECTQADAVALNKKINAARTYLSDNRRKLESLRVSIAEHKRDGLDYADEEKEYDKVLAKVQARYDFLCSEHVVISDDQLNALRELGIVIDTNENLC